MEKLEEINQQRTEKAGSGDTNHSILQTDKDIWRRESVESEKLTSQLTGEGQDSMSQMGRGAAGG